MESSSLWHFFIVGFRLLSVLEFLTREMEMYETESSLLKIEIWEETLVGGLTGVGSVTFYGVFETTYQKRVIIIVFLEYACHGLGEGMIEIEGCLLTDKG